VEDQVEAVEVRQIVHVQVDQEIVHQQVHHKEIQEDQELHQEEVVEEVDMQLQELQQVEEIMLLEDQAEAVQLFQLQDHQLVTQVVAEEVDQ
jgi:hypothetical protein